MRVSRLITNRRLFTLLLSVILLIIVAGITLRAKARNASWPERVIMDVQSTMSGWVYRPVSKLTSALGDIQNLHEMYLENARLKSEMQNYSQLTAKLQDVQAENSRLNTMLNFKHSANQSWDLVPAHIVGREPALWGSQLTIDVGHADGIQPNMAVIAPDGSLVGRVAEAAAHSSKVILITDTQVGDGVSSIVQNGTANPPFGVVVGSAAGGNRLELTFLSPIAQIHTGDMVVTSGLSSIFPKGIIVGKIITITQGVQGLTRSATIAPSANFDYLEDVSVVKVKGKPSS